MLAVWYRLGRLNAVMRGAKQPLVCSGRPATGAAARRTADQHVLLRSPSTSRISRHAPAGIFLAFEDTSTA
jgi:hypothetical protein